MDTIKSLKLKIEQLESHNKVLLNMYENVREFKHDYGNFIQILDGYSKINSMEGVRKLCNKAKLSYRDINSMGMLTPDLINNPMLYNIIVSKFFTAREYGININLESMIDFESVKSKVCGEDFLYIFTELLDNAIEAAKFSDKKEINITFSEDVNQSCIYVIIENTYKETQIDFDKLYKKGYTTRCKNSKEHGFGLWNVKKILKHSDSLELFTSKGDMFIQEIKIKWVNFFVVHENL